MKKVCFLLLCITSFGFSQVGINTTSPDPSSALDIESTEAGILVPRMTEADKNAIPSPANGLLIYQTDSSIGFWYYQGGAWTKISDSASSSGEFSSLSGIVQNTTDVNNDDFVFGDTDLQGSGTKFFFDKSKGAFRAGNATGTEWDDANVGTNSVALGFGNTAAADGSFAFGSFATADADNSVAFNGGQATGIFSFAGINGIASGQSSIALLEGQASGLNSLAIGIGTTVAAERGIAFGNNNTIDSGATNGLAFGVNNEVSGINAISIGNNNFSTGEASFTFGSFGTASALNSVAFNGGQATGNFSFAGINGIASGESSIAFLDGQASGLNSLAIGIGTTVAAERGIAFGNNNTIDSGATNGLAFGVNNEVSGINAISIGNNNFSTGEASFTFGSFGTASALNSVAFNGGQATGNFSFAGINGIASGESSIAFLDGQASGLNSLAIGIGTTVAAERAIALGSGNTIGSGATNGLAFGSANEVTGLNAVSIGNNNFSTGQASFTFGSFGTASALNSVAFNGGQAAGNFSFAGINGIASGESSIAFLDGQAAGLNSLAIGIGTTVSAERAIALGSGNTIGSGATNGLAFGSANEVTGLNAVSIGNNNFSTGQASFTFGSFGTASALNSVAFNGGQAAGNFSFAGINGIASGESSIAFLDGQAAGLNSLAIGIGTTVSAERAIALGSGNTIGSGATNGLAFGSANEVTGLSAVSIGNNNFSTGEASFTFGSFGTASGQNAVAFNGGQATGDFSFAGINGTSSGEDSVALGEAAVASGAASFALGNDVQAFSFRETVIGYGSASYTPSSTTAINASDRLFVVANNTGNNALNILKNGRTGIGRIPTTNVFEVEGDASKNSAGDWAANSDRRLKKNIATFSEEKALSQLLKMRGVTYEWNDDKTGSKRPEGVQYGFIAQELMEVFPENVEKDNLGYYQTAYGTYDALYVQSIKALVGKIERLEAENDTLKEEIEQIYSLLKSMELDELQAKESPN
ncbi:tail fiber domain-containing protein [Altibacter sp. HG106]|uniref:tail fiber domain-containing protein n=1 Tax=Altibacter sp. HG106 TaxID=3023937 RepID=UPI00235023CE|nr:tail fiber domain-containing protein [Altibacter sp. HG106]MDC7994207.1 tail fiber domain-containing protein [Altibacter sp. HG106]